jgi:hypothetical protein
MPEDVFLDTKGDVIVLVMDFEERELVIDITMAWLEPRAVYFLLF